MDIGEAVEGVVYVDPIAIPDSHKFPYTVKILVLSRGKTARVDTGT